MRKKITLEPKTRKRTFTCAAAILVVVTALTLFSGCVEEDEDRQLELGEPMEKVNHYVGTEGFNVDVDDIFGEKSIYYLAEKETGAKSSVMEFKPCALVVEETYLGEDGAEIIKYKIGEKRYDKQQIEKSGIKNIEDSYLPEGKIPLMIKKLPDGTYDLSDLTKSTKALGWEHPEYPGYFPGSDKNPKVNDNIIGNNRGKPELRNELILVADRGIVKKFNTITIFNKAYLKKYGILAYRRVRPGYKFPDNDYFRWANEVDLEGPIQPYKELFGGELLYTSGTIHSSGTDALIAGSPDYEYGTIIQKAA